MIDPHALGAMLGIAAIAFQSLILKDVTGGRWLRLCRHSIFIAAIANLWCLALVHGAWTPALFLAFSLAGGALATFWQRGFGHASARAVLPWVSGAIPLSAAISVIYIAANTPRPEWFVWCPVC